VADYDPLLVFEQLHEKECRRVQSGTGEPASGTQHCHQIVATAAERAKRDVGVDDDALFVHDSVWMKRLLFSAHHCALPASAIASASVSLIALRRVADSSRNQLNTSSN
jgi:hypothetical protein